MPEKSEFLRGFPVLANEELMHEARVASETGQKAPLVDLFLNLGVGRFDDKSDIYPLVAAGVPPEQIKIK